MMPRAARVVLGAAALLLAACADRPGTDWAGSVETLPNGALRVANPADGLWQDSAQWRLRQELVIGSVDGPEPTVFSAIVGLEVDDSGRVYVLDRQANELRIFAADGSHVRTVGRSGGGPGEYANANGLRWLAADTLLIIDQRGNRYSILTRDGDFVRSVQRSLPFFAWSFRGAYADGMIYETTSVGSADSARPALLGTSLRDPEPDRTLIVNAETQAPASQATSIDTVFLPVTSGPAYESFSVRNERGGMVMGVPFSPRPVYHVDHNADIWHGRGDEFRIVRSTFAGDTLMEILLDAQPSPVDAAELEAWLSSPAVERFREMGGELDTERIPKVKPYFDDVIVDREGFIWAFLPTTPGALDVAVFQPDGRHLGRMHADGLNRDSFVPPVVRNGRLHVVGRDDMDVQHVWIFRIDGRPPEASAASD